MRRAIDRLTAALRCTCGHSLDIHSKDGFHPCKVESCTCEAYLHARELDARPTEFPESP